MNIQQQFKEIENYIPKLDVKNTVSSGPVGWHIDHSLQVINSICKFTKSSNPEEFKPKFSLIKWGILLTGKMPRGKAKAPKHVTPTSELSAKELQEELNKAKKSVEELNNLHPKSHFPHPFFGHFNLKQTHKFITIHTEHHLKIVRDILGK